MHRLIIEVDGQLYRLLESAAQVHHLSLEAEAPPQAGGAGVPVAVPAGVVGRNARRCRRRALVRPREGAGVA